MRKYSTITSIGEVLVDFLPTKRGVTLSEVPGFLKCAGGAAANISVGVAKLGIKSAFIGAVGNDPFGIFLRNQLRRRRVDTSGMIVTEEHKTRLAFVSLTRTGDRKFEFWERNPADVQLNESDIDMKKLSLSAIVHCSSFLLLQDPSRSTALSVADKLQRKGILVSFDPNLRLSLWRSHSIARDLHLEMIRRCSILKLNEHEALFLAKKKILSSAVKALSSYGPAIVVVTTGQKGCLCWTRSGITGVSGFRVRAVDTTGCGDGFLAALLCGIVRSGKPPDALSSEELNRICHYANAAGAITAMREGAIGALPDRKEIKTFMNSHHS